MDLVLTTGYLGMATVLSIATHQRLEVREILTSLA
jgi:hypothetical protein